MRKSRYKKRPSIVKWTFEVCKELALKCKFKKEFKENYNGAYQAAKTKKWMNDICGHMIPIGNRYNRCIYAYEFSDNSAYIGLTYSIDERNKVHTNTGSTYDNNNSAVREHILKTGLTPKLNQLTGYINYLKAAKEEDNWVEKYRASGFTILNKMPTGVLSLSNTIYTKEKCKEILMRHEYKQDARREHPDIFTICKRHRWHASIIKKMKLNRKPNNYWTKKRCAEVVKSVSSIQELRNKNVSVYNCIGKNGWKDELLGHLNIIKPHNYWDKEMCKAAAASTTSRGKFGKKFRHAYDLSRKNKWLDEFFPKN